MCAVITSHYAYITDFGLHLSQSHMYCRSVLALKCKTGKKRKLILCKDKTSI
jgi:hypothetical protein